MEMANPESNQRLEQTEMIIAVGRGIKSKKNIDIVRQITSKMNIPLAATRAAVDMGLIFNEAQIGQTGLTVNPKLYLALGVSGSLQHMCGVKCDEIWAVNQDKNALIFKFASFGIVADLNHFLPAWLEMVMGAASTIP